MFRGGKEDVVFLVKSFEKYYVLGMVLRYEGKGFGFCF